MSSTIIPAEPARDFIPKRPLSPAALKFEEAVRTHEDDILDKYEELVTMLKPFFTADPKFKVSGVKLINLINDLKSTEDKSEYENKEHHYNLYLNKLNENITTGKTKIQIPSKAFDAFEDFRVSERLQVLKEQHNYLNAAKRAAAEKNAKAAAEKNAMQKPTFEDAFGKIKSRNGSLSW